MLTGRRRRRPALAGAALAVLVTMPAHVAAEPALRREPRDVVRAWVVEWAGGARPATQDGLVRYTGLGSSQRAFLLSVGFYRDGSRREFHDALYSHALWASGGALTAEAYADGHGRVTPSCDTPGLCSTVPALRQDGEFRLWSDRATPTSLSFYVVSLNIDISRVTTSPGWHPPREISGVDVRLHRYHGTGVHYETAVGGGAIEHFRGLTAAGGRFGSLAYAFTPCPVAALPHAPGRVELRGGDARHMYSERDATCWPYHNFARGSSSGPTEWQLAGESAGWASTPDRLTVVDLPRG